MARRRLTTAIGAMLLGILASSPAMAQQEGLSITPDMLRNMRRASGDSITFCVNANAMMASFERAVAGEIASALLLNHDFFEVNLRTQPYDFRLPLEETEIFILLARHCDAILGFTLLAEWPGWMTPSPPYVTTRTVLALRPGEFTSMPDIPGQSPIGTRMMSMADGFLYSYTQTLPESQRWKRMVYPNNTFLLERLVDGTVVASLIWEPAVLAYKREQAEAAGIVILRDLPFPIAPTEFVLALRPAEDFLNASIAEAITSLRADGVFDRLAVEHGVLPPADAL